MSLTNPNTPVSQQDLQDFYHKLLPYMGGSFGMIANKFSKGDMYSTNEKMIGQWIGGKPLYQKTVTYTLSGAISDDDFTIPVSLTDLETVAMVYGMLYSGANIGIPLVTSAQNMKQYSSQLGIISIGAVTDSSIQIRCPKQSLNSGDKVNVTVRYTKTTDSAISIGNDTDYSTEEKIVGTWIDGKPLYQKTITGLTVIADGQLTTLDSNVVVRNIEGITENGSPLNNYSGANYYIYTCANNTKHTIYMKNAGFTGQSCYITIQYTKTTT